MTHSTYGAYTHCLHLLNYPSKFNKTGEYIICLGLMLGFNNTFHHIFGISDTFLMRSINSLSKSFILLVKVQRDLGIHHKMVAWSNVWFWKLLHSLLVTPYPDLNTRTYCSSRNNTRLKLPLNPNNRSYESDTHFRTFPRKHLHKLLCCLQVLNIGLQWHKYDCRL